VTHPPGLRLARVLTRRGVVQDTAWHRALLAVDRRAFIPPTVWVPDPEHPGWDRPITRDDPDYRRWADDDYALVTQVDDGRPAGADGRGLLPTSSISQPSLVVAMLQALDVRDGMRVLEIGTGTGYNAALLCARLGDANVVSVEIDSAVAAGAAKNLAAAGFAPRLVVGDGAREVGGPFDRVIATVAARRIPPAWITQTAPGGVIVTPWGPGTTSAALLRLTAAGDGGAGGRLIGDAAFMWLRDQRRAPSRWPEHVDAGDPAAIAGPVAVNPRVVTDRDPGWGVVLGHLVPDLAVGPEEAPEDDPASAGEATVYLFDRAGSWALAEYVPSGGPFEALRCGPRDLWGEVAAARAVWEEAGCPGRDRLGLTVTSSGEHRLWVDTPDRVLSPRT
jgi:protein-L-isoaspartate(D-aspartate) O-methyltransferase